MAVVEITVPQMGEGLQEVRIVTLHKKPGDNVKRDETLYTMETDKALLEVESPQAGVLTEWLAEEDTVLPIGATIARMETSVTADMPVAALASTTAEPMLESAVLNDTPADAPEGRRTRQRNGTETQIPPRTRAYCKELGISEDEMHGIAAPSGKLMPADVDAHIAARKAASPAPKTDGPAYTEKPLSHHQRTFVYRIKRSAQMVVPVTIKRMMPWGGIRRAVEVQRERDEAFRPSEFQTFAYCVARAVRHHPKFRSSMPSDDTSREYAHLNLGVAVAHQSGDLLTALVREADTFAYDDFIHTLQKNIRRARDGEDQAAADMQLVLTYMGNNEIEEGFPLLVSPAIATLFIGATYGHSGEPMVTLVMTFDHRLINGVEAAEFLKTVVEQARKVEGALAMGQAPHL